MQQSHEKDGPRAIYDMNIFDVMDEIHDNPAIYIGRPSLTRLDMFLHGFCQGRQTASGGVEAAERAKFQSWYEKTHGVSQTLSVATLLLQIHNNDEDAALKEFFQVWYTYARQAGEQDNPV